MIGTIRSQVNFLMNKFRRLGFIRYNGGLQAHSSLLCSPARAKTGFAHPKIVQSLHSLSVPSSRRQWPNRHLRFIPGETIQETLTLLSYALFILKWAWDPESSPCVP